MRLKEAEVDVLSIVRNDDIIYLNNTANHLFFAKDKDGDQKLDGRVVRFVFSGQLKNEITEFFVALDETDSYTLFTMQMGIEVRLNYIVQALFNRFVNDRSYKVFAEFENYSTQYFYTFRTYKKDDVYFMINNSQTQAYLIDRYGIIRDDVNQIKNKFRSI